MMIESLNGSRNITPILYHTCTDEDLDSMPKPSKNQAGKFDAMKKQGKMKCLDKTD